MIKTVSLEDVIWKTSRRGTGVSRDMNIAKGLANRYGIGVGETQTSKCARRRQRQNSRSLATLLDGICRICDRRDLHAD